MATARRAVHAGYCSPAAAGLATPLWPWHYGSQHAPRGAKMAALPSASRRARGWSRCRGRDRWAARARQLPGFSPDVETGVAGG